MNGPATGEDGADVLERFRSYRATRDRRVRNELVEHHRGLALHLARRFADRGEPLDDLAQVAMLGLLKAVERFDPDRGIAFSSFATPTVTGEIKRHFRDRTWSVRVPRRAQERRIELRLAAERLHTDLQRPPTVGELAADLQCSTDEVLEAMEAGAAYRATSLSRPVGREDTQGDDLGDRIGEDPTPSTERDLVLDQVLGTLAEREERLLRMRFFEDLTQTEIAQRLGISQMHVSRLLRRSLLELRERLGEDLSDL